MASCFYVRRGSPENLKNYKFILGAYNYSDESEPGRQIVYANEIKIHEKYKRFHNEIGLVRLNSSITFNEYIQPICLLTNDQESTHGFIASWGARNDDGYISDIPRLINLEFSTLEQCLLDEPRLNMNKEIVWENSFCTKRKENIEICMQDSGSGIFVKIGERFYLKGYTIAGLTVSSCYENFQTMSLDLSKFFNFIKVRHILNFLMFFDLLNCNF